MLREFALSTLLLALLIAPALATEAPGQGAGEEAAMTPEPALGLPLGSEAPEFTAQSFAGDVISLRHDLLPMGEWLVIVTYRGGWCPYCNRQLHDLSAIHDALLDRQARLIALSVDLPDRASATQVEQELPFMVLSDPSAAMFEAYNIAYTIPDALYEKYKNEYAFDVEEWSGQGHHIVTHPAVIILDPAGFIRFFHANEDYKVRLTNDEVLAALEAVQQPADKQPVI